MRRKNHQGININEQEVNVNEFGHTSMLNFSDINADIIILAYQPGIGKTYNILDYMKTHPNSFYFTDRHKVIEDNIKGWKQQKIDYSHWEGHERKCNNPQLKHIVKDYKLSPSIACEHCNRGRCTYRGQFSQRERVFAPFEYLPTNYVMGNLPEIIFLDESKIKVDKLSFNQEKTVSWLQLIQENSNMPGIYINMMESENYPFFIYGGFDDLYQYYREAQNIAFKNNNLTLISKIGNINPHELSMYFRFAETYGDFQRDHYFCPLWYYAFDIVNRGTKLVYLDASFNKLWFKYMLECFNGEIGFDRDVSVLIYKTDITNKNTQVYNMRYHPTKPFWCPKVSLNSKYFMIWFPQHLKKIKEIYGEENVGLITFKMVSGLKNKRYAELFDNQYFGNIRSSNALINKRVLVILGTYFGTGNQVFEHLEKLFNIDDRQQIQEEEEQRREYERDGLEDFIQPLNPNSLYNKILVPKRRRRFTDSNPSEFMGDGDSRNYDNYVLPVMWIQRGIWDNEMYQAFHRNRGLQNNRIIFAYCWFPPQILKEFSVKSVERTQSKEEEFWKEREAEERNRRLIGNLIKEISVAEKPKLMKTYLSEKYRMFGRENRNTIEQLIDRYLEIKDKIKPPNK